MACRAHDHSHVCIRFDSVHGVVALGIPWKVNEKKSKEFSFCDTLIIFLSSHVYL